jgi:2'-5' RNA ligase
MANMYFIALVAPGKINEEILKWKNYMKEQFGSLVALRSPAHITLVPPFWMEEAFEEKLKNAVTSFSGQQNKFEITLKNFAAFKPKVIYAAVLPSQPLQLIHSRLQKFLKQSNLFPIKPDDRPFHPHISIAARDLHKKAFYEAWEIFRNKRYEASWLVNSISMLRHNQKNWDVIFTSQFPGV